MDAAAKEVLTESEVRLLMRACSERAPTGIRNRALVALLFGSGIKIAEALALAPTDVDLVRGTLLVGREGSARRRSASLFDPATCELETWLRERERLRCASSTHLFCTLNGRPLHDAYVRAFLGRLARRTRLTKRVSTLGLRDAFCAKRLAGEWDAEDLRCQLGHGELRTTLAYLHRVSGGVADRQLMRASPVQAPPAALPAVASEPDPGPHESPRAPAVSREFRPLTDVRAVELEEF